MKCEQNLENLAAYLDDEIDGAPRRAMDAHMSDCAACAAERASQASAWALLDTWTPSIDGAPDTAALVAAVRERDRSTGPLPDNLKGGGTPAGRLLRLPSPALAGAAAAGLLAVAGALSLLGGKDPAGDTTPSGREAEVEAAMLEHLEVLESLEVLEDRDLELLEDLDGLDEEALEALGG